MPSKDLSDKQLWDAIVNDDSQAFAVLLKRYWKKLFITAHKYLKDSSECEQIVQEIFIYLWEKRSQLKIESFEKYLNASARYHVFKQLKQTRTSPVIYTADYADVNETHCNNVGDEHILSAEYLKDIDSQLNLLPNRCKEIFLMSRLEHFSNNEIAEKLHISKRTVENQITYALKHLRVAVKYLTIFMIVTLIDAL